jgi:hypothetical protein
MDYPSHGAVNAGSDVNGLVRVWNETCEGADDLWTLQAIHLKSDPCV